MSILNRNVINTNCEDEMESDTSKLFNDRPFENEMVDS